MSLRFGFASRDVRDPQTDALPLAERVAGKILARQAAACGERPFVHFGSGWTTYAEANRRANRVANALAALGLRKGARVAILLRNRLEYLDLWFGLSKLGAVQLPINTEYKAAQVGDVLRRGPIDLVVVESALAAPMREAIAACALHAPVLLLDPPSAGVPIAGARAYAEVIDAASADEPATAATVGGADVGAIMNTSGTTGPSKGVLLSQAQQYILGRNMAADMALGEDDVYYNFFPLFHNTAQAMITLPVLLCGARMVLADKFSASRFWPEAIAHRCTAFYYIGEILRILLKSTSSDDARGARLRLGWGIGASAADFTLFQSRFGIPLGTGYGSTEGNVPTFLPAGSTKPGSAGRVVPGFELRIADAQGASVDAGTVGEILIRSSEPCATMRGYDGNPAATVDAWQDLWFHSGDAGYLDADGDLFFVGRMKDAIRVRGENVSAFEVEQAVSELEGVLEVAAIAVPAELGGDDVKIVVVAHPGAGLTPQRLVDHALARLPRYAVPRYVELVAELPKTPTNKVQKHVLRTQPFTPATWDRLRPSTPPSRAAADRV